MAAALFSVLPSFKDQKRRDKMILIDHQRQHDDTLATVSGIFIREGNFHVKTITSKCDSRKVQRLRHQVFAQELGWVEGNEQGLETDEYDEGAISFGVFDRDENLKACLRVITSDHSFMLENEFPFLLSPLSQVRKAQDTVEISRLCVALDARSETFSGNFGVHTTSMLLYKGVYRWCLKNRKQYIYLVVEQKVFRLLCAKGFPCKLVGEPKVMPDGVVAVAAILNWREFEQKDSVRRSNVLQWFSQNQSHLPITQWQRRGYD
jgi:acyl homoserine lactone synthase